MERIIVLDDGETFSNIGGCVIVSVPDGTSTEKVEEILADEQADVTYAFTGDETGGVALTDDLDKQVKEALNEGAPESILRAVLANLAKACDIESDYDYREEP